MKSKLYVLIVISLFLSCTGKKNKNAYVEAICIVDGAPVYEKAEITSQPIAFLQLGESVKIMNHISSRRVGDVHLTKIQFTNGILGWTRYENLVENAFPAAILKESVIYQYPERDAPTDKKFHLAEFAVVADQNDAMVRLLGTGKKKEGWVPKECISTHPNDVSIALMAYNKLLDRNGVIRTDKLSEFLKLLPDKNTSLAIILQKLMDKEVADAIEQSIMEYEQGYNNEDIQSDD
jgi:hypothetical protein